MKIACSNEAVLVENGKEIMTSLDVTEQRLALNFVFSSKDTSMQNVGMLEEPENMPQVNYTF
jgi:hypothetical protein